MEFPFLLFIKVNEEIMQKIKLKNPRLYRGFCFYSTKYFIAST